MYILLLSLTIIFFIFGYIFNIEEKKERKKQIIHEKNILIDREIL